MSNDTPRYYGQNGEDYILGQLCAGLKEGFFVEIGCIDGRRFSNTLTFEEQGWRGMCIEAHEDYIPLLKKNRPNSIVCHCAAGKTDEEDVPFYANNRGSLSTLDPSKEEEFRKRFGGYFSGFQLRQVKKRRLDTLLKLHHIRHMDILSIDVEGSEADVLEGLDLNRCRPRVMVIEADTAQDELKLDHILLNAGYFKSIKIVNNVFYLMDKHMDDLLKNKKHLATIIHTQHPLDNGGDMRLTFTFEYPGPVHISKEDHD
ncbi:MAG: hypothetical protein QG657_1164 [Acidobacteriota bacterium]|nr:hypothetical protein [Acidobacteriota bacterium]